MRTLCRKSFAIGLLVAFLVTSTGRAVPVKAVGTTIAAAAGTTLLAVGLVYCSYMALSGAVVNCPNTTQSISDWLTDMGRKVVQFPSGRDAYEELYPQMLTVGQEPVTAMLDRAWTWTRDKLMSWANDFSSTDVIQNIATYTYQADVSDIPTNGFTYSMTLETVPELVKWRNGNFRTFDNLYSDGYEIVTPSSTKAIIEVNGHYIFTNAWNNGHELRNYYDGEYYYVQEYVNGDWTVTGTFLYGLDLRSAYSHNHISYLIPLNYDYYTDTTSYYIYSYAQKTYPLLPNERIYDETTDTLLPLVIPSSDVVVRNPQYPTLPPDDDHKYPIIPFVQLPYDPNWIDPITHLPGGGNWGFNLSELLDTLEDLAGSLMDIGAIATLINTFKDLMSSNDYYIYYDDSENTYYEYYTITNYGGDTYNYDIDVSHVDEQLPVDLNTIQIYTQNRYVEQFKQSAIAGGSIIRDLVVFWYDVDPEIVYCLFGACILTLIGAFIGKWGHS